MSESRSISAQPTEGLSYDPAEAKYWDEGLLDREITRAFDICHGCRMCFKYCDTFPDLFRLLDEKYDGDVRRVTPTETEEVLKSCFQCKLCEVQCPYTPRDGHEFQLDFPRLVHRHAAVAARDRGVSVRDRLLGDPDGAGRLARASRGLADLANRLPPVRWVMEKLLGIDRRKLLPPFASRSFDQRAQAEGRWRGGVGEAVLFPTCYVQNNEPEIGLDTLEVLDHNGVDVRCQEGLGCCGMPAWEHGDLDTVRARARVVLDRLMPHVDAGAVVLAINPTCSMTMRREYPELVAEEDRERARRLAAAVRDPSEYLWSIRDQERFRTDFASTPGGALAYHAPCHLRAQAIGFRGRDLMRKIPGVVPSMVLECSGHDGTYAMKVEGFEPSARLGRKAFDQLAEVGAELWASDCPLAALQFQQHAGHKALHPMSVLARAYRAPGQGGFERAVEDAASAGASDAAGGTPT